MPTDLSVRNEVKSRTPQKYEWLDPSIQRSMQEFEPTIEKVAGVAEQLTPWLRASDSRNKNDVYASSVVLPSGTRRQNAFVKIFPAEHRSQRVYNEVIAHHLAIQCSLPSPFTFPCACHVSLLRDSTREKMVSGISSPYVLGVASLDGNPKAVRQSGGDYEALWADLMNWPQIANVAVFDELLGNDDRHISNLVRCGPHDYSLIDNERILFGENWFGQDLTQQSSRRCDANIIADTIAEGTDELMRRRMLTVAQKYVMQIELKLPRISLGLEALCGAPEGSTLGLVNMLNKRRLMLQTLMQWHMRKGDLFQASTFR